MHGTVPDEIREVSLVLVCQRGEAGVGDAAEFLDKLFPCATRIPMKYMLLMKIKLLGLSDLAILFAVVTLLVAPLSGNAQSEKRTLKRVYFPDSEISFIVPEGYRLNGSDENKFRLLSSDHSHAIFISREAYLGASREEYLVASKKVAAESKGKAIITELGPYTVSIHTDEFFVVYLRQAWVSIGAEGKIQSPLKLEETIEKIIVSLTDPAPVYTPTSAPVAAEEPAMKTNPLPDEFFYGSDELLIFQAKDGKYGFQRNDKIIIPAQYDEVESFIFGRAALVKTGKFWGAVNSSGQVIIPIEWEHLYFINGGSEASSRFVAFNIIEGLEDTDAKRSRQLIENRAHSLANNMGLEGDERGPFMERRKRELWIKTSDETINPLRGTGYEKLCYIGLDGKVLAEPVQP